MLSKIIVEVHVMSNQRVTGMISKEIRNENQMNY